MSLESKSDKDCSGDGDTKGAMVEKDINLTDPEDVMRMLQTMNITDAETDRLIDQASAINKLLKGELRKKESQSAKVRAAAKDVGRNNKLPAINRKDQTKLDNSPYKVCDAK